jgi:multidrug efflux pump subunit AcrB
MTPGLGPAGKIGQFFINSKLTPLLVIASLALGALAVAMTPREEEPQIVVPVVDIFVGLPGAAPSEVENRVTIPLEKRMWEIPGVEYVYSVSMADVSMITVRFYVGDDEERSLVKLYQKLLSGLDQMPQGATPPLVKSRTIDDVPVLGLTLWSDRYDGFDLRRIGTELRRELGLIDNVSDVQVIGGQRRQVLVHLDAARLAGSHLDPGMIVQALQLQNATVPSGSFEMGGQQVLVETNAFLKDAEEIADLVVGVYDGRPVFLRDVATITDGAAEAKEYVFFASGPAAGDDQPEMRADGDVVLPAVTLTIAKRKGSDAHEVVSSVLAKIEDLDGRLIPPGVNVTVTRDYGETAKEKADELLTHLIVAIISVSIVIALSLGWRGALVVFISVPVSFALTLFVYYVFGYTLNRVTLFALIFVTGIVVDDSIIVVENIVRHLSMKKLPPLQAAITAVNEVGNPTILATLTVIASVLPMAFVRGLMGPYMRPMPVGASLAMIFSLLVALIAAPWFAYRLVRKHGSHSEEGYNLESSRTYRVYRRILLPLLQSPMRRWAFLGIVVAMLLASVALLPLELVSVKMLPFDNKSEVQIILDMPEGTTLESTSVVAREMAAYLRTVPEVTDLQIYAGTAAPINFNGLVRHYDLRAGANVADIQVNLASKDERRDQSHAIAKRIRPPIQDIASRYGIVAKVLEIPPGPPVLSTLVAEAYGPTQEARIALAAQIKEIFDTTDGVVDTDWLVEAPQPKRVFEVDHEKAALQGVPAVAIARTLRLALEGEDVGILHQPDELEPVAIRLQLPRSERSTAADLASIRMMSMNGTLVPLSELGRVVETTAPVSLHRKNLQPVVYVIGEVAGTQESPVYAILDMAERVEQLERPDGTKVEQFYRDEPLSQEQVAMKWDGEWHITYEVFRDLGAAFGAVLILIYILIIGWFGSFETPLTMMIAIPLALVGVLPGHWLFGAFFTATSMIGFIALAGIMVRNSVLLIDFVNLSMERGKTLGEAVIEAGAVRFRPILLTAGTVVVGAVVILFDPIFEGLAIALMTGAIASTVLTLVVVPLVHFIVEKRHDPHPLPPEWELKGSKSDTDGSGSSLDPEEQVS